MYACIWCKCSANDRWDMDKQWSISDPSHGARTIEENMQLASRPRSKKQYNVTHKPLFPSIPLTNVVIDNLHLFLRVSDVLFNRLVIELKHHDSLEKVKKLSSFDPMKYHHLDAFQKFVTSLGIPSFRFYVSQNSKLLKCRSLTGPEKLRLFRNISIANVLPKLAAEEVLRIQVLWTELVEINQYLSKPPEDITSSDIDKYAKLCRQWVVKFTDVYHTEAVTPYMQCHSMRVNLFEYMDHSYHLPNMDLKSIMISPQRTTSAQRTIEENKPYYRSCRSRIVLNTCVTTQVQKGPNVMK